MRQLKEICSYLDEFAPPELAEQWDNVGLLAGDPESTVTRLMTCLTITPQTALEAVRRAVDLVVTHHPLPFRALKRLVTTSTPGRLLWDMITHKIAIYSPHTAFDSAAGGVNQQLAEGLGLGDIGPLKPIDGMPAGVGVGRVGQLPQAAALRDVAERLQAFLAVGQVQFVGDLDGSIQRVGVACGAAGELLSAAQAADCDLLVLGETNLHTCLEAQATNTALLLPGHYASERFAVDQLAEKLAGQFPDLEVWPSADESDPMRRFPES
jgi:dinuclear metal center YbgI/SA1388 family protein